MKTTTMTLLALLAAGAGVLPGLGCNSQSPAGGRRPASQLGKLSIAELEAKMQEAKAGRLPLYIYDNNSKERYAESHLPGAKWVEFDEITENDLPKDLSATLVFYCSNEH
jgi:hypothetical protein